MLAQVRRHVDRGAGGRRAQHGTTDPQHARGATVLLRLRFGHARRLNLNRNLNLCGSASVTLGANLARTHALNLNRTRPLTRTRTLTCTRTRSHSAPTSQLQSVRSAARSRAPASRATRRARRATHTPPRGESSWGWRSTAPSSSLATGSTTSSTATQLRPSSYSPAELHRRAPLSRCTGRSDRTWATSREMSDAEDSSTS